MQDLRKKGKAGRGSKSFDRRNGRKLSRYKILLAQIISAIILVSCSNIISEKGTIDVYLCPECEDVFANFVNRENVQCAFFDLDSKRLIETLVSNNAEILVFEDNHNGIGERIGSSGLMHNKFCVVNDEVITGSTNPTERGFNVNYNNLVVIKSKTIADNYRQEFLELKKGTQRKTQNTIVNLSGTLVANYFCPEDSCEEKVLRSLGSAENSIYFMLFSFTSDAIGDLLVEKSKEIEVKGQMESFGLNDYSEYEKLVEAGIQVELERTGAMLHHKVFIIDNETLIIGSYNPTKAGNERNDENILIIRNKEIAKLFLKK